MEGRMEDYEVMKVCWNYSFCWSFYFVGWTSLWQLLGKGSFGSVYCVKRIVDRTLHVMKKISIQDMPPKERKATEQECKVLQRLRHPGIRGRTIFFENDIVEISSTYEYCEWYRCDRALLPGIVCYEDSFIHKNRQVWLAVASSSTICIASNKSAHNGGFP